MPKNTDSTAQIVHYLINISSSGQADFTKLAKLNCFTALKPRDLTHKCCRRHLASPHEQPDKVTPALDQLNGLCVGHVLRVVAVDFDDLVSTL